MHGFGPAFLHVSRWRSAHTHKFPLLRAGSVHSGSASQDNHEQAFSQIGYHIVPGQHSQPTSISLGQVCICVICNLPPPLLAEWPGSFTCHCSNMGMEQTPNKNKLRELTVEKTILPPLSPPSDHESITLINWAILAPQHSKTFHSIAC